MAAIALTACLPTSSGGGGDDNNSSERPCGADERVSANACVPCDLGYENAVGDDPLGQDTECDPLVEPGKGRLVASPARLPFGPVEVGSSGSFSFGVLNIGDTALTITSVSIAEGGDDTERELTLTNTLEDSTVVEPGASESLEVTWAPVNTTSDSATITFALEGALLEELTVEVTTPSGAPDTSSPVITLGGAEAVDGPDGATHRLDFGARAIGQTHVQTILVENDGAGTLVLDEVTFSTDGALSIMSTPELVAGLEVEPGESVAVRVAYAPTDTSASSGELTITSNDEASGDLLVQITGQGSATTCPTAVGHGRVSGSSRPYSTAVEAEPLQTIELDGSRSVDAARYEWTITQRPANSTARLTPDSTSVAPELFLDLVGNYTVELATFDADGVQSCERSVVNVVARASSGLTIQAVWDTPMDMDQTDISGTDVDLHYLNKLGSWDRLPYDIYWKNPGADWGVANDPSDDPELDIEDSDGAGPENINHDRPSPNEDYSVGVYYYSDNGFGPSYVTLRIFVGGALAFESRDKFLEREKLFWHAVDIDGQDLSITTIDSVLQDFP